jgi:hypothetical protein
VRVCPEISRTVHGSVGGAEHSGEKCRRPQVGRVLLRLRSPRLEVRTWVGPRWREARYMYVHVTVHMDRTL